MMSQTMEQVKTDIGKTLEQVDAEIRQYYKSLNEARYIEIEVSRIDEAESHSEHYVFDNDRWCELVEGLEKIGYINPDNFSLMYTDMSDEDEDEEDLFFDSDFFEWHDLYTLLERLVDNQTSIDLRPWDGDHDTVKIMTFAEIFAAIKLDQTQIDEKMEKKRKKKREEETKRIHEEETRIHEEKMKDPVYAAEYAAKREKMKLEIEKRKLERDRVQNMLKEIEEKTGGKVILTGTIRANKKTGRKNDLYQLDLGDGLPLLRFVLASHYGKRNWRPTLCQFGKTKRQIKRFHEFETNGKSEFWDFINRDVKPILRKVMDRPDCECITGSWLWLANRPIIVKIDKQNKKEKIY